MAIAYPVVDWLKYVNNLKCLFQSNIHSFNHFLESHRAMSEMVNFLNDLHLDR